MWVKLSLAREPHIAVAKPLKYLSFMMSSRVIQMVLTSWTIPFLFFLTIASTRFNLIFRVSGFVYLLFEVILCVILIFCLASILLVVYKNSGKRRLAKQSQFNQRIIKKKTHHRSAVTRVALVTSMFPLCYRLLIRCSIVVLTGHSCNDFHYKVPRQVVNSEINPIAYAFFKRDMKQ